jgi:hypothetical protein
VDRTIVHYGLSYSGSGQEALGDRLPVDGLVPLGHPVRGEVFAYAPYAGHPVQVVDAVQRGR